MSFLCGLPVIAFLLLAGCSDSKAPDTAEQTRKGHIFEGQARALEKAKGVEQGMQDAADRQRRAMERQEQ